MNTEKKKNITEVIDLLAERDPAWKHPKMLPMFKVLYQGWRVKELRHHVRSALFYTVAWQRNWLPIEDWRRFRDYAMQ